MSAGQPVPGAAAERLNARVPGGNAGEVGAGDPEEPVD